MFIVGGVHIDTRNYKQYLEQYSGGYRNIYVNKVNIPLYSNLKLGSEETAVGCLQFMLQKIGYNIAVDCKFGLQTEEKVKDFQRLHNLKADGIVGQQTWKALIEA